MDRFLPAAAATVALASAAGAQTNTAARPAELLGQRAAIDAELRTLEPPAVEPAASTAASDIVVTGQALSLTTEVTGQTVTTIERSLVRNTPATTIADFVRLAPGVAVIGGNGPRDVGVSIRGSNARQSFGARNIQVFEDDFPVTEPDGLARFDLTDPHAYGAVDVVRGPSSARYGNYALGGAVNFRTRQGTSRAAARCSACCCRSSERRCCWCCWSSGSRCAAGERAAAGWGWRCRSSLRPTAKVSRSKGARALPRCTRLQLGDGLRPVYTSGCRFASPNAKPRRRGQAMSSKADTISPESLRRVALVAAVAAMLWAMLIAAGIALF